MNRGFHPSCRVVLIPLWAVVLACSSSSGATSSDEALDRLRDRLEEVETNETVAQSDPSDTEAIEQETNATSSHSMLLEPRYFGALPDDDPRVLGVFRFRFHPDPIVDGDTVAVNGLDASVRMIGIDTEESFRSDTESEFFANTEWDAYLAEILAEDPVFPKFATPMGEIAKDYAHEFFNRVTEVRLEHDDLSRTRGYFDRYLVYVFVEVDGQWLNYNLEAVRAGMTPYFTKYGYSARFHNEFLEAEAEAQENQRGVWDPSLSHYPDYSERRAWWDRRADNIVHFETTYGDAPNYVNLGVDEDWANLETLEGEEIVVFGTFSAYHFDWDPQRVQMGHQRGDDFTLVGFRHDTFAPYDLEQYDGEYVYVRGELQFYQGGPQFIVDDGIEVWLEP